MSINEVFMDLNLFFVLITAISQVRIYHTIQIRLKSLCMEWLQELLNSLAQ